MNATFSAAMFRINNVKLRAHRIYIALSIGRAFATAMIVTSLWLIVEPARPLMAIALGGLTFLLLISFTSFRRKHHVDPRDFLLGLDINHQNSVLSPFEAAEMPENLVEADWSPRLVREVRRVRAIEMRRLTAMSTSITIPALAALLVWFKAPPSLVNVLAEASNVLSLFEAQQTIEVLSGPFNPDDLGRALSLDLKAPLIKLLPQNMLRFSLKSRSLSSAGRSPPSITLAATSSTRTPVTFQMQGRFDQEGRPSGWILDFSAVESSRMSLSSSEGKIIADFEVVKLPIPEVTLALNGLRQDPWPDNLAVPLMIHVKATNPLKKIQLLLTAKGKTITEVVSAVYGDTSKEISTEYKLNLEPYMSEDALDFEIVAQAIDSAQPQPLSGNSDPILLHAASAYGRYKATLATLSKIKSLVDDAVSSTKTTLGAEAEALARQATAQADTSPFFDTLDRMTLAKMLSNVGQPQDSDFKTRFSGLVDLSHDLGNFLFEHETLDDRERDRDFFIAVRTFSRVLEKPKANRLVSIDQIVKRLKAFLDQRYVRWKMRVDRLPEAARPTSWSKVRDQKPFHAGVEDAYSLDSQQGQVGPSQVALTKATNSYKAWLDDLESKEDEYRQKKEREQQQGMANARNELRELQQRQDQISSALDRSESRPKEDLASKWQSARPQQNSNVKQAKDLLAQLRAMSPESGERLAGAMGAMEETSSQGNKGEFASAESASDAAGRLLRDAEQSAARRQQQQQQGNRGRRKRAAGDDYYGNALAGGDFEFKTEYQVDSRYREDILNDVLKSGDSAEDKALLDNYLRQILR
ncbi:MAG: hypothetical protein NTV34_05190 [Proteobacteria bacterium]|nr:hypothetical protein [Pseudomonadota bacterium]